MISIVGTVGVPACYGGFESLVENLLSEGNVDKNISVYCSSKTYERKVATHKNARLVYIPLQANGVQSVPYDILSLIHAVFKNSDTILLLGVSGAIALPFVKLFSNVKIVTNIDGLEWKRDKWGWLAKTFLKFSESLAVKYSDEVVSDNKAIADYVFDEYKCDSQVIAYGGDHAVTSQLIDVDSGYALALCRIEPENNVEMILGAFSKSAKRLKFIGNWDGSDFGRSMKSRYQSFPNIEIIDPIYELSELFDIRRKCSFYVHGHSAGGTNPSLVEMMHFSKSILAYDCNYNRETTEGGGQYFSNELDLMSLIESGVENGPAMLEIAERRYTWGIVKKQYFKLLEN